MRVRHDLGSDKGSRNHGSSVCACACVCVYVSVSVCKEPLVSADCVRDRVSGCDR